MMVYLAVLALLTSVVQGSEDVPFKLVSAEEETQIGSRDIAMHKMQAQFVHHFEGLTALEVVMAVESVKEGSNAYASLIYGISMLAMFGLVFVMYFNKGIHVCCRVSAYLFALATVGVTVKTVFVTNHFPFSKIVTATHFISGGLLCFGIMGFRNKTEGRPIPVPSMKQFLTMIVPIAAAFALSIGTANLALVFVNVSFVEMAGGLSPLCVLAVSVAMGRKFDISLLMPVLAVCAGIAMCASGELKFSMSGFLLIFVAAFLRAIKACLQQSLMDGTDPNMIVLEPTELLGWMCVPSTVIMMVWSFFTEGTAPYARFTDEGALTLSLAIALTCVNACILNVSNLFVVRDLGAVATQLAGRLKGFLVLLGGIALMGDKIQVLQFLGFATQVVGIYWYNQADAAVKATAKASAGKVDEEKVPLVSAKV